MSDSDACSIEEFYEKKFESRSAARFHRSHGRKLKHKEMLSAAVLITTLLNI